MNRYCCLIISILLSLLLADVHAQNVVKQVTKTEQTRQLLLLPEKFQPYGKGFQAEGEIFHCDNGTDTKAASGLVQRIALNQTQPEPIRVELSSKAENVSGAPSGHNYGLYLDIIYTDGTPLWGQVVPFAVGTHDWETKVLNIHPEKPIKEVFLYAMFRSKSGKVAFRDMKLSVQHLPDNALLFDGVSIVPKKKAALQIRDVAAHSDYVELEGEPFGVIPAVKTEGHFTTVTLRNPESTDRCLTLVYAVDVPAEALPEKSWYWCEHPRSSVPIKPDTEYMLATSMPGIGGGRLSLYPFAAVSGQTEGVGVGIDMRTPAFFRTGYHSGTGELFVAVDVALTKESPTVTINFVRLSFDPKHAFRGALDAYYRLFPESFASRTPNQGVWMPFAAISKVPGHEDFGFQFKEGTDETVWDDEHHVQTFRYTEPGTWWMPIPQDLPQDYKTALEQATKLADQKNPRALALFSSGMHDTAGKLVCQILDTPWNKGAVWSMNDMPEIENGSFLLDWSPQIFQSNYGQKNKGELDGEYVDSSEGYVTAPLDFNRKNFAAAQTPLTFSTDNQPAIFRGLIMFEYVRKIANDIRPLGKLTMANGTPGHLCWLAPWFDVLGTETNWNSGGKWRPMADSAMLYRRALCGQKPFCFLMNTDFSTFSHELSERFMKRCLAYGMFPGFFSADASTGHYFSRPELYERDRELFKKYVPLCKRIAEAGWQPLTQATSSDPKVYVERFGGEEPASYFTVFNDSQESKTVTIQFEYKAYGTFHELVYYDGPVLCSNGSSTLTLPPEGVAVLVPHLIR